MHMDILFNLVIGSVHDRIWEHALYSRTEIKAYMKHKVELLNILPITDNLQLLLAGVKMHLDILFKEIIDSARDRIQEHKSCSRTDVKASMKHKVSGRNKASIPL